MDGAGLVDEASAAAGGFDNDCAGFELNCAVSNFPDDLFNRREVW
jgi:hypothetical protein